jgi:hypothetical protein
MTLKYAYDISLWSCNTISVHNKNCPARMLLSNLSGEMGDGFWEMQQECFRTADDVDICLDHS